MKNKGKSRMKKLIAAAMLVCMLTCSLDTGFVIPVLADDGTPTEQSVDLDTSDVDVLDVEPGVSDTTDTTVGDPVTDDTATNGVPTEQGETEENAPAEGGEEQTEQPEQQETEQPEAEQPEVEQPETEQPEVEQPETEQPEATSVSLQAEADGVKFTALNVDESFPYVSDFSNFSLTVVRSAISDVRLEDAIAETNDGDVVNLSTYDLHFFNGSNEVVPNSNVSVMVENAGILPEEGQWIQTYFYNKADGTAKKCPTQWNKSSGAVTVTVKDNGEYALTVLKVKDGIKLTTVANDVEITLTAPADAFPQEGELTLAAEEITDERLEQAKETVDEKMFTGSTGIKSYRLFDVTPMLDGKEVQPEKPVRVAFKNLILTDEEGTATDAREKLEEKGKVVTEENEIPKEAPIAEPTGEVELKTTEVEDIKVFHFEDENTPEEINVAADTQEVVTELEHFSWVMFAAEAENGADYDVGDHRLNQSYEAESHDPYPYSLDYILSHYNVFCSGDYLGTHVVGPMVVGGQTVLNGSLGGTTDGKGDYVHTAPSYLEGLAYNRNDTNAFPEIITCNPNMPIYVGTSNIFEKGHPVRHNPYYVTPTHPTDSNILMQDKMYVDFRNAFPTNVPLIETGPDGVGKPKPGSSNFPPFVKDQKRYDDDKRPWNVNDAEHYKPGADVTEPTGAIYGSIKHPEKGSINYYRQFDGYDVNGRRVLPVHITKELFEEVLNETNDGDGLDENGEALDPKDPADVEKDRQMGVTKYYQVYESDFKDENGEIVKAKNKDGEYIVYPVTKLNKMNNGRGAVPTDFDTDPSIDKHMYAFAIDSKNTSFRIDEQGGQNPYKLPTIDVSVRLRPGFNFKFDTFRTDRTNTVTASSNGDQKTTVYNGKVANVVYDYITDQEMSNNLMIITTEDKTEQLILPRIYKSVDSDSFGSGFQFNSRETGPAFSALWFAPFVREVYVGFTNSTATKDATNGSKLVGHLCVPQADVWLGGGDYNGCVIARNVDAASAGAEGHMWPFVIGSAINGVRVQGLKKVDGTMPLPSQKFFFKYLLEKKTSTGEYIEERRDVIGHNKDGNFRLDLLGGEILKEPGDYRITVSELKKNEFKDWASENTKSNPENVIGYVESEFNTMCDGFTFDDKVYQGTFTIKEKERLPESTVSASTDTKIIVDPNLAKITWKVKDGSEEFEDYSPQILEFNNTSQRDLKVVKEWKKDGKIYNLITRKYEDAQVHLTDEEIPVGPITVDLYRDSSEPTGHKINLNIFHSDNTMDEKNKKLISSELVGYVDDGESVSFKIACNDTTGATYSKEGEYPSAGIVETEKDNQTAGTVAVDANGKKDIKINHSDYKATVGQSNDGTGFYRGAVITVENVTSDTTIDVLFVSPQYGIVSALETKRQQGGFSKRGSDGKPLMKDVVIGGETYKVEDRYIRPLPTMFDLTIPKTAQDAWNTPAFLQKKQAVDENGDPKFDEKGKPVYELEKDESGQEIPGKYVMEPVEPIDTVELTKDTSWEHIFKNLAPRDEKGNPYYYKVVETSVPEGFSVSYTGNITRIINSNKIKNTTIEITNKQQKGAALTVNKVDEKKKPITTDSAEFNMFAQAEDGTYDSNKPMYFLPRGEKYEKVDSKKIDNATATLSTANGKLNIGFLPYGKYVLVETKAPNGYALDATPIKITIDTDKLTWTKGTETGSDEYTNPNAPAAAPAIHLFTMDVKNKVQGGPPLPNSGGPGFRMFTIGGISFIAISLMIIYYEIARRRKEDLVQVKQTYHKNKM